MLVNKGEGELERMGCCVESEGVWCAQEGESEEWLVDLCGGIAMCDVLVDGKCILFRSI